MKAVRTGVSYARKVSPHAQLRQGGPGFAPGAAVSVFSLIASGRSVRVRPAIVTSPDSSGAVQDTPPRYPASPARARRGGPRLRPGGSDVTELEADGGLDDNCPGRRRRLRRWTTSGPDEAPITVDPAAGLPVTGAAQAPRRAWRIRATVATTPAPAACLVNFTSVARGERNASRRVLGRRQHVHHRRDPARSGSTLRAGGSASNRAALRACVLPGTTSAS